MFGHGPLSSRPALDRGQHLQASQARVNVDTAGCSSTWDTELGLPDCPHPSWGAGPGAQRKQVLQDPLPSSRCAPSPGECPSSSTQRTRPPGPWPFGPSQGSCYFLVAPKGWGNPSSLTGPLTCFLGRCRSLHDLLPSTGTKTLPLRGIKRTSSLQGRPKGPRPWGPGPVKKGQVGSGDLTPVPGPRLSLVSTWRAQPCGAPLGASG